MRNTADSRRLRLPVRLAIAAVSLGTISTAIFAGGSTFDQVGHTSLLRRVGSANLPTGTNVVVGHVEAFPGGTTNYLPDFDLQEFNNKNFIIMSGTSATSVHATAVGKLFYGNASSVTPGVESIYMYSAGGWIQPNYLRIGYEPSISPSFPPPGLRIFNCSWIGDITPGDDDDNEALRRADYASARDNVLIVCGENNSSVNNPLLSHQFNGIAVGRTNGSHSHSDTRATIDGPGRMNPQLVAPGSSTSNATPMVSSAAALLHDAADSLLAGNPNASRSEVIKALLLAGAAHEANGGVWTNNPDTSGPMRGVTHRPIDDIFGAGTVNVDRAHRILTAGEQNGSLTPPSVISSLPTGWDLIGTGQNQSTYWRFNLPTGAAEISVAATWNRRVNLQVDGEGNVIFPSWTAADLDLELWRVGPGGALESLVGDAGVLFFDDGNVVSSSSVDNVEHLYITGVAPGEYIIELRREDVLAADFDVAVAWLVPRPADVVFDGVVNVQDLLLVLAEWGACDAASGCPANTNNDNTVDVTDLLKVLSDWG